MGEPRLNSRRYVFGLGDSHLALDVPASRFLRVSAELAVRWPAVLC